ncbi:MAG TPA: hypothetical protein VLJ86_27835 [Ramlibacter sp.]|nr:hypothetical protein [Ramlibacter sp.]
MYISLPVLREDLFHLYPKGNTMKNLLAALLASVFAVSTAFAASHAGAPMAAASGAKKEEKAAAPAAKKEEKKAAPAAAAKKEEKKEEAKK